MWEFRQKCSCERYDDLAHCHVVSEIATVLPNDSYYTVVASIFLVSAASCEAICGVASVQRSVHELLMR